MNTRNDPFGIAQHVAAAQAKLQFAQPAVNVGNPFSQTLFQLEELTTLAMTKAVNSSGAQLLYRREGSVSGGRLDVSIGGQFQALYPGSRIVGPFQNFQVKRNPFSARVGPANLLVMAAGYDFFEPSVLEHSNMAPIELIGSVETDDTVTQTIATLPNFASAAPTNEWFFPQGLKRIRLILQETAPLRISLVLKLNNYTLSVALSEVLIPGVVDVGVSYQTVLIDLGQYLQRLSSDGNATNAADAQLGFYFENAGGAAATVSFIVLGVE